MEQQSPIVGVVRGTDKLASFRQLLELTRFDETLLTAYENAATGKSEFKIVIKPNMMVFMHPGTFHATVTDKDLVEALIDHILELGFSDVAICEAQHDVGTMLKNHNVAFVAKQIGYDPRGRYKIVDLTLESRPFRYHYQDERGREKTWKDRVGQSWQEADFRVTFAKCKTHEHDWMTLGVKNIYGCFPRTNMVCKYHIQNEVDEVTARSIRNFPVHFCFIDAWVASDGFQGYKIANPKELKMLFGGPNAIAVDMEAFKRAGVDPHKSKILGKSVEQVYDGDYPPYRVAGDTSTLFSHLCDWENVSDEIVNSIDVLEEVYISWAFLNLKPSTLIDHDLFPPKNVLYRSVAWISKQLYSVFKLVRWTKKVTSLSRGTKQ
ncbi:MAG: DUF362 domain-containing protein [Anaerolineae bacterium]|nr:DUF362 domain-containing protein [Anaerolineae bacterium]